ncbi:glycosyltransferase family 9 protein [Parvibaculum sp.]|uniref:glycosyltransferase family 9 protein n=1 Tax=Parvibaculum sp. TaxID=2024848 RepID=UPI001B0D4265|nr:glycosyltransferase family 9 protein [Parvibaculum sp.]MBO6633754.1 glycosyltransferase family 9 protein [Parvibaculum sp.]MBO6677016.1 glycosyltransferase family 9 protein [Parvibaculum sp.]MBO6683460.1 glycosyltransferase family 9 protein [Parvibaculum sp.]MBO6904837.1 glycosyltransferase family 9 protein [Parvibaculum sp.]
MTSPAPFAADAKRILVIKHGAFGDVIQAEGALHDIRENHPDAHIAVLTMPAYRALLARCPYLDEVIVDERAPRWRLDRMAALRKQLRDQRFDMVYDLQNSKRTAFYYRWMLNDRRWSGTARGCSHPHRAENPKKIRTLDRLAGQLEDAGLTIRHTRKPDVSWLADDVTALLEKAHVMRPYIVLVPGCSARHPQKRWPHYGALAEKLIDAGYTIVMAPGPDEMELARTIPGIRLTDTHGLLSWYELAGVFKRALFVVGNDTGPSHLAAHIGTQGLALFGNYSPAERTGIIRENFGVIEVEDLAALPVERVFDEVTRRIEAHSNSV